MEVYHQYTKLRKDFGRHCSFSDQEAAEVVLDVKPWEQLQQKFAARNPVNTTVQISPTYAEHEANTNKVVTQSTAMAHIEGGWPKDIDPSDPEQVIRYRKKVERDEQYIRRVASLGSAVEDLVKENNAIDIYEEYFQDVVADHSAEQPYARTLTVFRDPSAKGFKRAASYISWCSDGSSRKVAIAYSVMRSQEQPYGMPTASYVWDVNNPSVPESELHSASQCMCVKYNSKDHNILGAGLYNGQLAVFDPRKGSTPTATSPVERSHKDPIYDFAWLQSKTGTECASVSSDGYTYWWDTRKCAGLIFPLGEPVETLALTEKGQNRLLGAMSIAYEVVAGPTKFMVGTEEGVVISCNRKAQDKITASYSGHQGPIYSTARNPFFPKYFLSIGDWTARIWYEDLRSPIITSKYHPAYLVGGKWSPVRPGVFFTIKSDGGMDVWDYFYRQNDPTLSVKVGDCSLTSFDIQDSGRLVTVGAADGSTTLYEMSEGLATMQQGEKQAVNQMLERETKQEKNLEQRLKERKFKEKRSEGAQHEWDIPDNTTDEHIASIEDEFHEQVSRELDISDVNPLEYKQPGADTRESVSDTQVSRELAGGTQRTEDSDAHEMGESSQRQSAQENENAEPEQPQSQQQEERKSNKEGDTLEQENAGENAGEKDNRKEEADERKDSEQAESSDADQNGNEEAPSDDRKKQQQGSEQSSIEEPEDRSATENFTDKQNKEHADDDTAEETSARNGQDAAMQEAAQSSEANARSATRADTGEDTPNEQPNSPDEDATAEQSQVKTEDEANESSTNQAEGQTEDERIAKEDGDHADAES